VHSRKLDELNDLRLGISFTLSTHEIRGEREEQDGKRTRSHQGGGIRAGHHASLNLNRSNGNDYG
jgi:hypothetical protein